MKKTIMSISNNFIDEAKASPRMLEDLAAMEKYMSESYDGRTFVELIQNADDANSSRIKVDYAGSTLIVANDGREFDENDIIAICRSGASNKQRGNNIGYRGVGFKSATTISTEIIIYSSGVYFTFSKTLCAETLQMNADKVPTVRIPFIFDENKLEKKVTSKIEEMEAEGFTTFFIFREALIDKFKEEISGFNSGWLLFLRKISSAEICLPSKNVVCKVIRKKHNNDIIVKIVGNREQWYITENNGVSLAFKYMDDKGIVACDAEDAVFHCYLPTLDKTGFPFKVNADFSTDPSRKHIIPDEVTMESLSKLGSLYVDFIRMISDSKNKELVSALALLNTHLSLGDMSSKFETRIEERLRNEAWILKKNGEISTAQNVTYLPNWLEAEEKNALTEAISYIGYNLYDPVLYSEIEKMDKIVAKYGAKEINADILRNLINGPDGAKAIGAKLTAKIFVYCYRSFYSDRSKMDEVFIPTTSEYLKLGDMNDTNELDIEFVSFIGNILNSKEKTCLADNYPVFLYFKKPIVSVKKLNTVKPIISPQQLAMAVNKWKTPIQNCLAVESLEGRNAKDVSRKCNEYSIESVDARGISHYIAVKKVKVLGDTFTLSETEYAAAQRLGETYKIFVISLEGENVEYMYIDNPVATVNLDKVVKEWEFICNTYETPAKVKPQENDSLIDQRIMKNILPEYFNSRQKAFLIDFIDIGEMEYNDELHDTVEKINSVIDFYTGMGLFEIRDGKIVADKAKINAIKKVVR